MKDDPQQPGPLASLAHFFGHAITLEQEAAERLQELAAALEVHNNRPLCELLSELAEHSEVHAREVCELGRDLALPELKAWEYQWPAEESPEAVSYGAIHYLMSPLEALEAALQVEKQAESFYRGIAEQSTDRQICSFARQFAEEEQEHVALVQARLDALPESGSNGSTQKLDLDPPNMPE